jgi:hypothetical protein
MGTMGNWLEVLFAGTLWGGAMFWVTQTQRPQNLRQIRRVKDAVIWTLGGLLFGILTTFHLRQAFTSPLLFLTVATVLGIVAVGWALRDGGSAR